MEATKVTLRTKRCTSRAVLEHLEASGATSIGDVERLAGINTHNPAERKALWFGFRELFKNDLDNGGNSTWAAVRAECHKRTARMVNQGLLSLVVVPA